jgi:hypothetical protein
VIAENATLLHRRQSGIIHDHIAEEEKRHHRRGYTRLTPQRWNDLSLQ